MHIHVVAPVTTPGLSTAEHFTPYARPGTEVTVSIIDDGPASIESHFDEVLAVPGILLEVARADAAGADALLIDCMGDPGLSAAREISPNLVMGPAQTSMHVAAMLGLNFSIVTTGASVLPIFHDLVRRYGLTDQLCSIRPVEVPVLELHAGDRVGELLTAEALRAVEEDGAHVIVLGCTGMRGWAARIAAALEAAGHPGIPVIDPVIATLKITEALVDLGLVPSSRSHPRPPKKPFVGYDELIERVER